MSFRMSFILLILTVVALGGFFIWKQWYALGQIVFVSNAPFSITIEGQEKKLCTSDRCLFLLFPRKYRFEAEKEGFEPLFGDIEIDFQKKSEMVISFVPLAVFENFSAETMQKRIFPQWQKNNETEEQKILSEIEEKNGFWVWQKKTPLTAHTNKIASDEVGRGFWIVSPDEIFFFSTTTKQNALMFSGKISRFLTLSSGDLLAEDNEKKIWWISEKIIHSLDFPFRLTESICSPAFGKFWGIAAKEGYPYSNTLFEWDVFSQKSIEKGDIEGFSSKNFSFSFCSPTEYGMMQKDGTAHILRVSVSQ